MSYPLAAILSSRNENPYYDILLYWVINDVCNLQCVYCWNNQGQGNNQVIQKIDKTTVSKINCRSLKYALDKTHKIFLISLSGGEPFLVSNILDVCVEITRKHFLRFNTNLVSGNIKEFTKRIEPQRVWDIEASCHIKELERHNLLDKYIDNFSLCKNKGFPIVAVERAYPPLLREVEKYREFFKKKGIELFFALFCGDCNGKHYPESYTNKELKIFGLADDLDIKMYRSKGKLCNAGYNVGVLSSNGNVTPCFKIRDILGNIFDKIKLKKELIECPHELCGCPLNCYHRHLFERALIECGIKKIKGRSCK